MDAVLHLAESLLGSPWFFVLEQGLSLLDAVVPVVPAETVVITAGAFAAAQGYPAVIPLILAAWAGALAGDVIAHHLGRRAGGLARLLRRLRIGDAVLRWAETGLRERGPAIIIGARFIPGGRTATTVTSGMIGYPRRSFVLWASVAALAWAVYSVGIGMIGGIAFHEQPLLGVALGIGIALAVAGGIEAVRRLRSRRAGTSGPEAADGGVSRPRPAASDDAPAPGRDGRGSPDNARRPRDPSAAGAA